MAHPILTRSKSTLEHEHASRHESFRQRSEARKSEGPIANTVAHAGNVSPKATRMRTRSGEQLRHIYVCAYYDELLTPADDEERKKRAHLAFKWDLCVRTEAPNARGTHFRLVTDFSVVKDALPAPGLTWRPHYDWRYEMEECAQYDADMILCMKIGTARRRPAVAASTTPPSDGGDEESEDDEYEIDELCSRIDVEPTTLPWEWTLTAIERLWENRIIWRHEPFHPDHAMQLQITIDLEGAYQRWKSSSGTARRRKTVVCEMPGLERLSCDDEKLQRGSDGGGGGECEVCCRVERRPGRYGFRPG